MHTKFHLNYVRIDILHDAVHSVIQYQAAKQCDVLKQQRLAEYVYNITELFVIIEL